jgi:hypothetical protein
MKLTLSSALILVFAIAVMTRAQGMGLATA